MTSEQIQDVVFQVIAQALRPGFIIHQRQMTDNEALSAIIGREIWSDYEAGITCEVRRPLAHKGHRVAGTFVIKPCTGVVECETHGVSGPARHRYRDAVHSRPKKSFDLTNPDSIDGIERWARNL
jgi:hypothetical protein